MTDEFPITEALVPGMSWRCKWCGATWHDNVAVAAHADHPRNGCRYVMSAPEAPREGEGRGESREEFEADRFGTAGPFTCSRCGLHHDSQALCPAAVSQERAQPLTQEWLDRPYRDAPSSPAEQCACVTGAVCDESDELHCAQVDVLTKLLSELFQHHLDTHCNYDGECWCGVWQEAKDYLHKATQSDIAALEWQPIETAPTDGSWFWAANERRISAYRYDATNKGECPWFAGTGWWPSLDKLFTHWTPMRESPPKFQIAESRR